MTVSVSQVVSSRRPVALATIDDGDHLDQPTFHERYKAMPESFKAELIGGRVYVASPLRARHGSIHAKASMWLGLYQAETPRTDVLDNATSILAEDSEPQPDAVLFLENGATRINDEGYLIGPAEFVAEVASSSAAYDLYEKKADYEKRGVAEYLVLLAHEKRAVLFARRVGDLPSDFVELPADANGILRSKVFPGLWLDAAALFRNEMKRVIDILNTGLATPEHASFVELLNKS